jgi:hypothetical protein
MGKICVPIPDIRATVTEPLEPNPQGPHYGVSEPVCPRVRWAAVLITAVCENA